jgi:hypothetical protein
VFILSNGGPYQPSNELSPFFLAFKKKISVLSIMVIMFLQSS